MVSLIWIFAITCLLLALIFFTLGGTQYSTVPWWIGLVMLVISGVLVWHGVSEYVDFPSNSAQCRVEKIVLPEYEHQSVKVTCRPIERMDEPEEFMLPRDRFPKGFNSECQLKKRHCGCLKTSHSFWYLTFSINMTQCDNRSLLKPYLSGE